MKQKLTRALIDEIRKEMPVLSQNEEKGVIGGTFIIRKSKCSRVSK